MKGMKGLDVQATYQDVMDGFFMKLSRMRGKPSERLAMLLYGAYAYIHFDYEGFEKYYEPVCPYEANICRAVADLLMVRLGKQVLTHEEIGVFFNERTGKS